MKNKYFTFVFLLFQNICIGQNAERVSPYTLTISNIGDKWGLMDIDEITVLPFIYDSIKYIDAYNFEIFKNGKMGHIYQSYPCYISAKCQTVIFKIDAVYDSLIKTDYNIIKAFLNDSAAIYSDDCRLLFPLSTPKKICLVMFSNKLSTKDYSYKAFNKNERQLKDNKKFVRYYEPILFYQNKYYRFILPIFQRKINGVLQTQTMVTEAWLTRYFKKILRRNPFIDCRNDASISRFL